ncbi:MAG TPA: DUF4190 domain-containing protein [Tepidisphaeraceae bacterium]|jgi:hypothetical protein|nr:DUF4190 domain-containing protein [Tepidisphaeraceae bacterium]
MTTTPPPPAPQNFSMQPRGNTPAVLGFVASLLGFCLPGIGGILGIIFGLVGLKRSRETASGRGLAIAAIIIGFVSLLLWSVGGYAGYKAYHAGKKAARHLIDEATAPFDGARQYVIDLNKGDIPAALVDSSGISKDQVEAQSAQLKPMGAFVDMTSNQFNRVNSTCTLQGVATFAKGTKNYKLTLIPGKTATDKWKVTSAVFQ